MLILTIDGNAHALGFVCIFWLAQSLPFNSDYIYNLYLLRTTESTPDNDN